jgi:hypothetical protein
VYAALTDLICVALVFVLAAFLFAMSVAIVMTAEGLKLLLRKWESVSERLDSEGKQHHAVGQQ